LPHRSLELCVTSSNLELPKRIKDVRSWGISVYVNRSERNPPAVHLIVLKKSAHLCFRPAHEF
jgi:hypothetical protein